MKRLLMLSILMFILSACSQYPYSASDDVVGSGAPVVHAGSDVTLTDADNLDQPYQLSPTVTDPNTSNTDLQMSWSGSASNPAPVSTLISGGVHTALFPRNGTYQLTLSVSDGQSTVQDTVIITVNASNYFNIAGNVSDNLNAVSGSDVELQFADGTFIENDLTDGSGSYNFDNLIGSVANFEVIVK